MRLFVTLGCLGCNWTGRPSAHSLTDQFCREGRASSSRKSAVPNASGRDAPDGFRGRVTVSGRRGSKAVAALGLLAACVEARPESIVEGDFVRVLKDDDSKVCGGTMDYMDSFVRRFSPIYGLEPRVVEFHLLKFEIFEASDLCPPGSAACYDYGEARIVSPSVPNNHEIVHALLGANGLIPDDFLAEGLAHLYEENFFWENHELDASIEEILDFEDTVENALPVEMRGRAAHFTRFIDDVYGAGAVSQLLERRISGRPAAEQDAAFLAVTGDDVATVLAKYAEVEECALLDFRRAVVECEVPPSPWIDGTFQTWSALEDFGCERGDVVGPVRGVMWATRTFDLEQEQSYRMSAQGSGTDSMKVVVGACHSTCSQPLYFVLSPGETLNAHLTKGRYYVLLMRHETDPGEIGVRIDRVDAGI